MRRLRSLGPAIGVVCALSLAAVYQQARSNSPADGWREIAWPFPRDGWPSGKAFRCSSKTCGGDVELYIRPKLGFCNCGSGVADDDEVDRVADLDLISEQFLPVEAGRVIESNGMSGRLRPYRLQMRDRSERGAIGIALSQKCDLFVAVVQGSKAADIGQDVLRFLASDATARWIKAAMESR